MSCSSQAKSAPIVLVNGNEVPYATWHEMLLPGEALDLSLPSDFFAKIDDVFIGPDWVAPDDAGIHNLEIFNSANQRVNSITLFVLEPATNIDAKGWLNGYRIGFYPKDTPAGFIKLERGDLSQKVSPSFKVGQFICKQQPSHWPKYVLVSQPNLKRLETLLDSVNEDQISDANTFFVMSGFRTPFYNAAIGSAKFSRHMYGDAADIYIDTKPRNGVMDDINSDGKITKADANFLYDYAEKLYKQHPELSTGGIGSYKANAVHGPFVHVDGRGRRARWGR